MSLILLECCKGAVEMVKCSCNTDAPTNCEDVAIAMTICCALVWITAIIVGGSIIWRTIDKVSKGCQERRKNKKDKEDVERKQRGDLLDKKLQILKELCYRSVERAVSGEEKEITKHEKELRSAESKEVSEYINAINEALGTQHSNTQTTDNEE